MKNKTTEYPISALREELRLQASDLANRLSRSVGRLTSCDALPCLEYGEEVRKEEALAQELFYIQHCRDALERCIAGRGASLRFRHTDGTVSRTVFRKVGPARVRVSGPLPWPHPPKDQARKVPDLFSFTILLSIIYVLILVVSIKNTI